MAEAWCHLHMSNDVDKQMVEMGVVPVWWVGLEQCVAHRQRPRHMVQGFHPSAACGSAGVHGCQAEVLAHDNGCVQRAYGK